MVKRSMMEGVCYTGAVLAVSWTVGPFIGGPLVTRLKMSIPRTLGVILIAHTVICFGYLTTMLLGCPEAQWAGDITQEGLATLSVLNLYTDIDFKLGVNSKSKL